MRIMIATDAWAPQINGVVVTLGQTGSHLRRLGHEIKVVHPGLFRTIALPGYPEIRLSLGAGRYLPELVRQFMPDALHIATEGPLGAAMRRYALGQQIPFTSAYHTRFPEYLRTHAYLPRTLTYRYLRRFHGAAVRTMVPTEGVRQELIAQGFDPDRLVVWSRGVDLDVFHPPSEQADVAPHRRLGRPPVFLYAGRVSAEKNLEAFLDLDLPGEKWVIGGGPALPALRKRYADVRFFGPLSHDALAAHYRQADVFVFPSLLDTFGLVLLEAMACGCPVAALPATSTRDVLGDSGAGVIDDDLRAACLAALDIPRERPAAYARAFSWANTTRTFLSHLQPIGAWQLAVN